MEEHGRTRVGWECLGCFELFQCFFFTLFENLVIAGHVEGLDRDFQIPTCTFVGLPPAQVTRKKNVHLGVAIFPPAVFSDAFETIAKGQNFRQPNGPDVPSAP